MDWYCPGHMPSTSPFQPVFDEFFGQPKCIERNSYADLPLELKHILINTFYLHTSSIFLCLYLNLHMILCYKLYKNSKAVAVGKTDQQFLNTLILIRYTMYWIDDSFKIICGWSNTWSYSEWYQRTWCPIIARVFIRSIDFSWFWISAIFISVRILTLILNVILESLNMIA